jgi:hypothetical protein
MTVDEPLRVRLSGARAGDYVIVEVRSDGSLVVAPDNSRPARPPARLPAPSLLDDLFSSRPRGQPATLPEALGNWGIALEESELVWEFVLGDVDGKAGYIAVTNARFIFLARSGRGLTVARDERLIDVRNVELVRRGRRPELVITWTESESVLHTTDKAALPRVQELLTTSP